MAWNGPCIAPLLPAYYPAEDLGPEDWQPLARWLRAYRARVEADKTPDPLRRSRMNRVNPKFVLRNYLVQQVIERAEAGDPTGIGELLAVMRRPYDEQNDHAEIAGRRPEWARHRPGCSMLSCSS